MATKKKQKTSTHDFEQSLKELEKLVSLMEDGQLSLEQALEQFEKGIKLTSECQKALLEADQKISILLEKEGQFILENFNDQD